MSPLLGIFLSVLCAFSSLISIMLGVASFQLSSAGPRVDVFLVVFSTAAFVIFSLISLGTLLLAHRVLVQQQSVDLSILTHAIKSLGVQHWRVPSWKIGLGLSLMMLIVGICWR